mgnify:CR=1 FL=1
MMVCSLLLVGGAKGKRLALPHSRVMIHQPAMGGIQGQASDIKVEAEMILGIRERVVRCAPSTPLSPSPRLLSPLQRRSSQARARPHSLSSAV